MLKFEIQIVADCKETGLVGKNVGKNGIDFWVQNIDKVDWTLSFDTVILGHTKILSQLVGRDWIREIFFVSNGRKTYFHMMIYRIIEKKFKK